MLGVILMFALKFESFLERFHCDYISFVCQDLTNLILFVRIFTYFISFLDKRMF